MLYRLLADTTLVVHLAFVIFVVLGGLLVLRWRWVAWLHVPAVLWGTLVELTGRVCPLTPLEVRLRALGGEQGYQGGFIEHYVTSWIYPEGLTRELQVVLGIAALTINIIVYALVIARARRAQ
ncbi:MAG: DUF2784 domain-containing protein [Gammaproteobacteria bacterium]|nr:DUF2784 domain-containing protein [Gammaproteobacteria bacterium]